MNTLSRTSGCSGCAGLCQGLISRAVKPGPFRSCISMLGHLRYRYHQPISNPMSPPSRSGYDSVVPGLGDTGIYAPIYCR
jgi:hypothetical protein